jgi:hypothetical protein
MYTKCITNLILDLAHTIGVLEYRHPSPTYV